MGEHRVVGIQLTIAEWQSAKQHIAALEAEVERLRAACRQAEQNIRNMGNGDLTGINQWRALNEAAKLRAALEPQKEARDG